MKEFSQNVFFQLIAWHFFDVPREILKGWKNYLKYNLEFFSVPLLLKTYFSYWRGYKWSAGRGFDLGRWLEAKFSNLISRVLGAFLRTFLIFFGIITEILIFILGSVFFLFWFFLPLIFIFLIFYAFKFI